MSTKNDLIEIRMRLLGAKAVATEAERAGKGIKGVGTSSTNAGRESGRAAKHTSVLTRAYHNLGRVAAYAFAAVGVAGVYALKTAVENTTELAKTTSGLNRNLGLSAQEGSRWAAVAYARGISTQTLTTGTTKLARSFVEANRKGGTARTALNQLGITHAQAARGAKDFGYALDLVANKFGKAKAGPERAAAAQALFGKSYSTILPLFSSGRKGLEEQLHWADKYGLTLDGKTNKKLMDFVSAQRESKVAVLGLEVSLTKALLPALKGGEEELQGFIATLNSPKLSGEQKINRIGEQFTKLENKLIGIIADALPKVAEQGGVLGLKLAGAVWKGFKNSGLTGKLVISSWLFKYMGGGGLIKAVAGRAGGMMARGLMAVFAPVMAAELAAGGTFGQIVIGRFKTLGKWSGRAFVVGAVLGAATVGYELGKLAAKKWPDAGEAFRLWGVHAGEGFVNGLISLINKGIDEINKTFNEINILGKLGVSAPEIGHVGGVNWENVGKTAPHPPTAQQVPFPPGAGKHHIKPQHSPAEGNGGRRRRPPSAGASSVTHEHIHLTVDGREMAEVVLRRAEGAAALI